MKNERTYDAIMDRLNTIGDEIFGRKMDTTAEAKKQSAVYNTAFWETMHTGIPENALKVGSDGSGGYLVPDTFDDQLMKALSERNVLRQIGQTVHTTQDMNIPVALGIENAEWVPEGTRYPDGDAGFGEMVLSAYKLGTTIRVSDELLEDSGVDLEKYIREIFAERIGKAEEDAFIHGDGNGKPVGLIHQATLGAVSEREGDLTLDDMIDLEFSLEPAWREKAAWLISEDALRILRRFNHYDGRVLWRQDLKEGDRLQLFGFPIYVCKSMDNVAPGSIPVMFGDFSNFWIGDRGKRAIKRLVERYADRGQVAFITTERVDAKLVLPETVKMLKISGTPAESTKE